MENSVVKFTQTITFKGFVIGIITLLLLIPGVMIQGLILERQHRSEEAVAKINAKWSNAQTLCGPILTVPYSTIALERKGQQKAIQNEMNFTPDVLTIKVKLYPEERYYGIYKAILYRSEIDLFGEFDSIDFSDLIDGTFDFKKANIRFGLSDLKGVTDDIEFVFNSKKYMADATGEKDNNLDKILTVAINGADIPESEEKMTFSCKIALKGSGGISFIPVGKTTAVEVQGAWTSPGFIGGFSPDYTVDKDSFYAKWNILRFNRNIPDTWKNDSVSSFNDTSFGVNLVETVDHYLRNMRSAKYALMFIALTFVVFFFVEILTLKRIHPIQYLLVGIALILFYSLLLSLSEQLNFALAYLIASAATIGLITAYAYSVFKHKPQAGILMVILIGLYMFLYVILQLEDRALMIGSIGLFLILAIIMYISRKVSWYKTSKEENVM
ncbi:MAG: cell envelope integrity protein CreD [Prevotellaceae bacterium]|jgi:inner membrane protein|nr:cell envelope integrity protein CreD [Prevotellaceae bacterium]